MTNIYRRPEVERITGLSRSAIYKMMADGEFPRPIRIGRRAVGWRSDDVQSWLNSKQVTHYE